MERYIRLFLLLGLTWQMASAQHSPTIGEIRAAKKCTYEVGNTYFYDDGGADGYISNMPSVTTLHAKSGKKIVFFFEEIDIPEGAVIHVYKGFSTDSQVKVQSFTKKTKAMNVIAEAITIEYVPSPINYASLKKGWKAQVIEIEKNNPQAKTTSMPESDCVGAIPICSNSTINTSQNQYNDTGSINDDSGGCYGGTGSGGSVWYSFSPLSAGPLDFTINPSGSTDYDFVLWDITNGCGSKVEVSCNWAAPSGATGLSSSGASTNSQDANGTTFNQRINVDPSKRYALCINYYSGNNAGFTLTFKNEASSVSVIDNTPPTITNAFGNGCASANQLDIFFSEYLDCSTVQSSDFTIPGHTLTITTNNCSGTPSKTKHIVVSVNPPLSGPGTYTLTGINAMDLCGNPLNSTYNLVFNTPPVADAGPDKTVCKTTGFLGIGYNYSTVTLTASGGSSYMWSDGQTGASINVSPTTPTWYYVTAQNGACTAKDSVFVGVEQAVVSLGPDIAICGSTVTLTATPASSGNTYTFYKNPNFLTNGTQIQNGASNTLNLTNITAQTTIRVKVTTPNGCSTTDDVVISLNGNAFADAGPDQVLCSGGVTLTGFTSSATYNWTANPSLSCTNCLSPVATPNTTTTYYFNAFCPNGTSYTDSVTVFVSDYGSLNPIAETTCDPSNITFATPPIIPGANTLTYTWYAANSLITPCPSSITGMTQVFTENKTVFTNQTIVNQNFDALALDNDLTTPTGGWNQTTVIASVNNWGIGNTGGVGAIMGNYLQIYSGSTANSYNATDDANKIAWFGPISTTNTNNLKLSFNWRCEGQMDEVLNLLSCALKADSSDAAYLVYSLNGATWTTLAGPFVNQAAIQSFSMDMPADCNNGSFYIGFRWVNDNKAAAHIAFPSSCTGRYNRNPMMVDNIKITGDVYQTNYLSSYDPPANTTDMTFVCLVTPNGGPCDGMPRVAANCSQVTLSGGTAVTSFSYSNPICATATSVSPTLASGFTTGGTFTSTAGLSINATTGVINASTSTIGSYTVTYNVSASGCAAAGSNTANVTISAPITPNFAVIAPICQNGTAPTLGATSPNGISGTWSPANINTATLGVSSYVFTPNTGQCATTQTLNVTISTPITPNFAAIAPICQNGTAPTLGATSPNGISGTWSPANINTATLGVSSYVFTPNTGQCATTQTLNVTISTPITPNFAAITPICQNGTAPTLGATSPNGISGTWSPASINTATLGVSSYVFTPNTGQCATTQTLNVTISTPITPNFAAITPICQNGTAPTLGATSPNGISGTWSPASINTATLGVSSYVFTPNTGQCATTQTLNVTISTPITPNFAAIAPICQNGTAPTLGATSPNGISGTWSPASINTATVGTSSYTFTPNSGQCATIQTLNVTITGSFTPITDFIYSTPVCANATNPLPTPATGFTSGGTYTSTAGLSINSTTGEIDLSTSTPGTYTVSYSIVATGCNAASVSTFNITITPSSTPVTDFTYSTPICATGTNPLPTPATGFTSGGTYTSTAGLSINSTTGEIDLSTSTPGTYTVSYSIAATGCNAASVSTFSITITPSSTPVTDFTYSTPVCATGTNPLPTPATGFTSGGTYTSTAGLSINATTGEIDLSTSTPGTYTVSYSITATACSPAGVSTFIVTINSVIVPITTFTYPTPVCKSGSNPFPIPGIGFTTGGTYSAVDPLVSINPITGEIDLTNTPGGGYDISYIVPATNCNPADTTTFFIQILKSPIATLSGLPDSMCINAASVMLSGFPAGGTLSGNGVSGLSFDPAVAGVGKHILTYTVTDVTCGTYSVQDSVQVSPLVDATFTGLSPAYCNGGTVLNLTPATNGGTFYLNNAVVTQPIMLPTTAGNYTLEYVVSLNGCQSSTSQTFTIIGLTLQMPSSATICAGDSIQLNPTSNGQTFTWSGIGLNHTSVLNPQATPLTTTTYHLTVTDASGACSRTDSVLVTVLPANVVAHFTATPDSGLTPMVVDFTNLSQNATDYIWIIGQDTIHAVTPAPTTFKQPGKYKITLIANPYACPDTMIQYITVTEEETYLYIPNVFTPNEDGLNDSFIITSNGIVELSMKIYDRWGVLIFESNDISGKWTGTYHNKPCPESVYMYRIEAKDFKGKNISRAGSITLLR